MDRKSTKWINVEDTKARNTKKQLSSLYFILIYETQKMDTTRQHKIAKLIQKELAEIFLEDGIPIYGCMITVTQTKVTSDLSLARSYLSIFNAENNEEVMKTIKKNTKDIRYRLAQKIKNHLRSIPQLVFFIDDSLDYLENIENLLKS